jgi:hypothetical protein
VFDGYLSMPVELVTWVAGPRAIIKDGKPARHDIASVNGGKVPEGLATGPPQSQRHSSIVSKEVLDIRFALTFGSANALSNPQYGSLAQTHREEILLAELSRGIQAQLGLPSREWLE